MENFVAYLKLEMRAERRGNWGHAQSRALNFELSIFFRFSHFSFISFVHFSVISNYECIDLVSASTSATRVRISDTIWAQMLLNMNQGGRGAVAIDAKQKLLCCV